MIQRFQKESIREKLNSNKLLFINGPRKVGKSELIESILREENISYIKYDCNDKNVRSALEENIFILKDEKNFILLEDAQHLRNLQEIIQNVLIGQMNTTLIAFCSFPAQIDEDLRIALHNEGLEISFYAPSFYEAAQQFGLPKEEQLLEERLIYGNYPAVLNNLENAETTLNEIIKHAIDTHLSAHDRVNKEDKLMRILQLLAFEIGDSISYNDLGERCGLDNETVERYITLLEKAHILIVLPSLFNGHRYELKKAHCIYFMDNGLRNVLISNFNPTHLRNDIPQLWKNYLVSERIKWLRINAINKSVYFWKTHTKQQMDYIELNGSKMNAYKMDWEKRNKVKVPRSFVDAYPTSKTGLLNRSTYWAFLTKKN